MSTNLKPTIGRRVWFWPNGTTGIPTVLPGPDRDPQPCDAGIAYVWNDQLVNLTVAGHDGSMHARTSVRLLQPGEEPPAVGFYATWMPYQVGQAQQRAEVGQVGQQQEARS